MFCYTNLKKTGGHIRGNYTEINKNLFCVKQILIGKNRNVERELLREKERYLIR